MGYVTREKSKGKMREKAHLNFMGGPSYDITNPLLRLRVAASSCFFGEPMYYHKDPKDRRQRKAAAPGLRPLSDGQVRHLAETLNGIMPAEWRTKSPAKLMESAIDAALEFDPEATLREAVRLRNEENIRTTPQVILTRAANHPALKGPRPEKGKTQTNSTGLVRQYAKNIVTRADEPAVCVAYHQQAFKGKPLPNSLKRALRDAFGRFKGYHLAKYRMEGHQVSTRDVAHLVHPTGGEGTPIHALRAGELRIRAKSNGGGGETWESILSREGKSAESWMKALDVMGHMALLRNVRNLHESGIAPSHYLDKLKSGAAKGRQLPFRYWSAYKALQPVHGVSPLVYDVIEECLDLSIGNLPHFNGRVYSLVDNSGSAQRNRVSTMSEMTTAEVGNLMGVLTGMASDEGFVGVFGDRLQTFPVRRKASVVHQLENANRAGREDPGGTENGIWLFWRDAIKNRDHYDHVFVYSDMQAGHGGLYGISGSMRGCPVWGGHGAHMYRHHEYIDVPKLIAEYRTKVNPNVMVYLVQIAGYQDTLLPEWYDKTYILGGWSESVLRFAAEMTAIQNLRQ